LRPPAAAASSFFETESRQPPAAAVFGGFLRLFSGFLAAFSGFWRLLGGRDLFFTAARPPAAAALAAFGGFCARQSLEKGQYGKTGTGYKNRYRTGMVFSFKITTTKCGQSRQTEQEELLRTLTIALVYIFPLVR
jgi:hypothetical protein